MLVVKPLQTRQRVRDPKTLQLSANDWLEFKKISDEDKLTAFKGLLKGAPLLRHVYPAVDGVACSVSN